VNTEPQRVAIVTGGGAGSGSACARRFARLGYAVVIGDANDGDGNRTLDRIEQAGGAALFVHADLAAKKG
jgi:NAD(P)-dependent dehydrogenase (short-subunit alcohol dehydrogenase family)